MHKAIVFGSSVTLFVGLVAACVGDSPEGGSSSSGASDTDGAASSGSSSSSTSSGGSTSSSSGASTSSSSSSSSSSTSGSTSSSGDAAVVCPDPLDPTIYLATAANCGAQPLAPEAEAIASQLLTSTPSFTGGTIPPGQYELVKFESNLVEVGSKTQSVYVFTELGAFSSNGAEYDNPEFGDILYDAQGTWSTADSMLTLTRTCKHSTLSTATTTSSSYVVRTDGCDVFLETGIVGGQTVRSTYRRRHE